MKKYINLFALIISVTVVSYVVVLEAIEKEDARAQREQALKVAEKYIKPLL